MSASRSRTPLGSAGSTRAWSSGAPTPKSEDRSGTGEEAMSADATLIDRVVAILTQRLGISPEVVAPTAELAEDLGVDSVDAVEFALALEREFNVALPDEIIADVRTVQDVVDLVCERTKVLSEAGRG